MSDDFKRKLEAYEKGELSGVELKAFEQELEKLEQYQEILDTSDDKDYSIPGTDVNKQRNILRRGKWIARLQTAFIALMMFILLTIVTSIITSIYYGWGSPDRVEVLGEIIDHTLTVTDPYGDFGGTSMEAGPYFTMTATRDINKQVGDETVQVGEMDIKFIFSLMGTPERKNVDRSSQHQLAFSYPHAGPDLESDWTMLENIPEGTVVSAFISFDELMETKEVFDVMENKNLELLWLAVDTGVETNEWNDGFISSPIGFPTYPIWHDDDMILDSREEEKGWFGSKIVSEGYSSPEYREGDTDILHDQFLKTLHFLSDHERKVKQLYFGPLDLEERIHFLEENGMRHYGIVITGPTKEVLHLKDESWVNVLQIDEIGFWNWHDRQ